MKKKIITGIAVIGMIAVSAPLAGCGAQATRQAEPVTKDSLLDKALDTFTKMESMNADINLNMDLKLGATGISMEMENKTDMNVEGIKDGDSHITGNLHVVAMGQEKDVQIESYTVREGDDTVHYSKTDDGSNKGNWTYFKTPADISGITDTTGSGNDISEMSISQIADIYSRLKESFSDLNLHSETVSYNNVNCYLMDGTIKGEKLAQLTDTLGQNPDEASLQNMKMMDLDTKLYFRSNDETPYAIEIDLGKAIENIISSQSEQMKGVEVSAEEMKVGIIFDSFNEVKEVKVPDSIKNNATESTDSLDVQSLIGLNGF